MALNFPDSPGIGSVFTDTTSGFSYEWDGTVWQSFTSSSIGQIKTIDDISSSFDNSATAFTLQSDGTNVQPINAQQLRVVLGGIVQNPGVDYTISGSTITFTTPPPSSATFSGVLLGTAVSLNDIPDGVVTPAALSTGGPHWTPNGDLYVSGIGTIGGGLVVGLAATFQSTVNIQGSATFQSDASFGDNDKLNLGDSNDLQIFHDGSNSIIDDAGTGSLVLRSDTSIALRKKTGDVNQVIATPSGSVSLFYDGTKRLETTDGGAYVYGAVGAAQTALIVRGDARITGIVTVGESSVTIDGVNDKISVGTNSPDGTLHIKGKNTHGSLIIEAGGTSGSTNQMYLQGHNNAGATIGEIAFDETATNQGGISFKTNGGSLSTKARIDSSGRLLVGTSNAVSTQWAPNLQVVGTDIPCSFVLARNDATVAANSTLAAIRVFGNDSNGTYEECARISADSDLDHGDGDKPTRLVFSTTADGASSPTERLRIGSSGQIGLGGANYGTSGQVMTSNGSGSAPTWQDAGGGAWNLISTTTASGASTVDFTSGINSTYKKYVVEVIDANPSSVGTAFAVRFYANGSLVTSSNYANYVRYRTIVASPQEGTTGNRTEAYFQLTDGIGFYNNLNGYFGFYNPSTSSTDYPVYYHLTGGDKTGYYVHAFTGQGNMWGSSAYTNVDGIRFYITNGTTFSGTFKLYGIS